MSAGIMAAIAGGLSNAMIGDLTAGASGGIIYGTGAGYKSGVRAWSWGGAGGGRSDLNIPVGKTLIRDRVVPVARTGLSELDIAIADLAAQQIFKPRPGWGGVIRTDERSTPVVVQAPPIPRPPVSCRPCC